MRTAQRLTRNSLALPGYTTLRRRINRVAHLLGGRRIRAEDLPDRSFLRNEFLRPSTHAGTHVDAPFHYGEECRGEPTKRITDLPLDWTQCRAVVIDVRGKGDTITAEDVRSSPNLGHIGEKTAVLFMTGCSALIGGPAYLTECPAFTVEAIECVLDRGAHLVGVDGWSLDGPAHRMVDRYHASGDGGALWPVHMLGRRREFLQVENLCALEQCPAVGAFHLMVHPVKLHDAGGAWARAVGMVPKQGSSPASG